MPLLTGAAGLVGWRAAGAPDLHRATGPLPGPRPGDVFLPLLERVALLPVVASTGSDRAVFPPIWGGPEADLRRPGARFDAQGAMFV